MIGIKGGAVRDIACAILLSIVIMLALPMAARAQSLPPPVQQLDRVERDVRSIDRELDGRVEPTRYAVLGAQLITTRQSAIAIAEQLDAQVQLVDARIAELGPKPRGTAEAAEVAGQRASLLAQRMALDAAVKRARLLDVEVQQLTREIQQKEARQFGARLAKRSISPFVPSFWGAVIASFDEDIARIGHFIQKRPSSGGAAPPAIPAFLIGVVIAALLVGPGWRGARRLGERFIMRGTSLRRARPSLHALWHVLIGSLLPALAALILVQVGRLSNVFPAHWNTLGDAFVSAIAAGAATASILGAVLVRIRSSEQATAISNAIVMRLRPLSWTLAGLTFFNIVLDAFNTAVGASLAAKEAAKTLEAGGSLILIAGALLAVGRIQASEPTRAEAKTSTWIGVLTLLLWLTVIAAFAALTIGYVEFSLFLVNTTIWTTVVLSAAYLIMAAVDDGAIAVFNRQSRLGRALVNGVGVRGSAIDQFGVLLSGGLRLVIALLTFILLFAAWGSGSGISSMIEQVAGLLDGIEIGGVSVSPGTILRGIVVLLIGLALVRAFMAWLERSYLPATDFDSSGRNSVSLIIRYTGIVLAAIWALASLGIGVERIALLLSALSVGIGFGLQAITQNFISGLILLAERPIKIGDLIRIGNDEGDVKRISVRSTEIELADHSTLIIPNSELITKPVINKTLSSPLGRVQIQFSIPIEADAAEVRQIVLDAFALDPDILENPGPSVFIDSLVDGRIMFNCFGHVASPRAAYRARSAVYMAILTQFRAKGIDIGTPPQKLELAPASSADEIAPKSKRRRKAPDTGQGPA